MFIHTKFYAAAGEFGQIAEIMQHLFAFLFFLQLFNE